MRVQPATVREGRCAVTNPECRAINRNGDCLKRNSRTLCEYCEGLLSDDELTAREVAFLVSDLRSKAQRQLASLKKTPRHCIKIDTTRDTRTCIERGIQCLCGFCVSGMTERQLTRHATKIVNWRNESRDYWRERAESDEYERELKARKVPGIDWNIEADFDGDEGRDYPERGILISGIFAYSKPCFIHGKEGLL
jgi:hypothetical protein